MKSFDFGQNDMTVWSWAQATLTPHLTVPPMKEIHSIIETLEKTTAKTRIEAIQTVKAWMLQGYKSSDLRQLVLGGKTMKKLKITEQLYSEVTDAWAISDGSDMSKLFHVAAEISDETFKANNLTVHDIPALAVGDFEVIRKFDIGSYYSLNGIVSKITSYDDDRGVVRADACNHGQITNGSFAVDSQVYHEAKPASEAEILQFDRVYHFHKQGRALDEFKKGDIIFNPARATYPIYEIVNPHNIKPHNLKLVCPVEKRGDL